MGKAEWGADPSFFGPRHAHREERIVQRLRLSSPAVGPHLECAAGVGSLSCTIAREGRTVVAADLSLQSLAVIRRTAPADRVLPVVADITSLPFRDATFSSATSAETLEHIPEHAKAVKELARVLRTNACLVGTVPAGPEQWSDWDEWADHQRRYTAPELRALLDDAGLDPDVLIWGWPLLRLYDDFFLKQVNRRRLQVDGPVESDASLRTVSSLGRRKWLVRAVRTMFHLDRLFDGSRRGVGALFCGKKR